MEERWGSHLRRELTALSALPTGIVWEFEPRFVLASFCCPAPCLPAVLSLRVLPAALLSCLVAFLAQRLHVTNSRLREFPEEGMRAEGSSPGSRRS